MNPTSSGVDPIQGFLIFIGWVMVYTGFLLEEIQGHGKDAQLLLQDIEILIDGPFIQGLPNTLQWRGSDNQRVHRLSPRSPIYHAQTNLPMPNPRP
ncbi:MAG: 4Fe-4S cluster-binding domain-containing protein [Armatimonadota bacterium]